MKKLILFTLVFIGLSTSSCSDNWNNEPECPFDCCPCYNGPTGPSDSPTEPEGGY